VAVNINNKNQQHCNQQLISTAPSPDDWLTRYVPFHHRSQCVAVVLRVLPSLGGGGDVSVVYYSTTAEGMNNSDVKFGPDFNPLITF